MIPSIIEAEYPLRFREEDAMRLGEFLRQHESVDIIGMKRVGISNFLRFFLNHRNIVPTYISKEERHVFIAVDLNDLIEREIFPFWTLTLKRIVDSVSKIDMPSGKKEDIEQLFLKTIQAQDHFLTIDSVRNVLLKIINAGYFPTLFFLRFDRMSEVATPSFFDNLQGLKDATHQKLSYVFTSYRSLDELSPSVFTPASLSLFCKNMYMSLAHRSDMETIYETYASRYGLELPVELQHSVLNLVSGYVQYLQLSLIILHENKDKLPQNMQELFSLLVQDERITLQSEELWDSLHEKERIILHKVAVGLTIEEADRKEASYLWETGFLMEKQEKNYVFSPLFQEYLGQQVQVMYPQQNSIHFSRKEHALFTVLEAKKDQICEREEIIEAVWPESKDFGISDWAIDRLIARVRTKLRQQNSPYEIRTIRTRGYQLVDKQVSS